MDSRLRHMVSGTGVWLDLPAANGVRYHVSRKSCEEIAQDYDAIKDAYKELLVPDRTGTPSAAHPAAAANTAYARGLILEHLIGRRGGELDFYVARVQVLDPEGRIVSRCSTPEGGGEWVSIATPNATPGTHAAQDFPTSRLAAVTEPVLPLPDVPLVIEDLLVRAKQLADDGAHREAIEEMLDQVAALRDGLDS